MARKKLYYGSMGPLLFDDEGFIADPEDIFIGMHRVAIATDGYVLTAGLELLDTDKSHFLNVIWNEDDTAERTLNLILGGENRTLTLSENFTIGDGYDGTITFSAASKVFTIDETATLSAKANLAGPTFTGTVTVPSTNFTVGTQVLTETNLTDLLDGGDTTLHDHDGISENTGARHVAVTLNASATTGGMSLSTQEISNRAATNAQTGYATAAHITAIEANTDKVTCNFANVNAALAAANATIDINSQDLAGVGDVTLASGKWVGLAVDKGRLVFTDAATDTAAFMGCSVGIGVAPSTLFHLQSNSDVKAPILRIEDLDTTAGSQIPTIEFYGNNALLAKIRVNDLLGMEFRSADDVADVTIDPTGKLVVNNRVDVDTTERIAAEIISRGIHVTSNFGVRGHALGATAGENVGVYAASANGGTNTGFKDSYGNYTDANEWVNAVCTFDKKALIRELNDLQSFYDYLGNIKAYRYRSIVNTVIGYSDTEVVLDDLDEEMPAPIYGDPKDFPEQFGFILSGDMPEFLMKRNKENSITGYGSGQWAHFLFICAKRQREISKEIIQQNQELIQRIEQLEGAQNERKEKGRGCRGKDC